MCWNLVTHPAFQRCFCTSLEPRSAGDFISCNTHLLVLHYIITFVSFPHRKGLLTAFKSNQQWLKCHSTLEVFVCVTILFLNLLMVWCFYCLLIVAIEQLLMSISNSSMQRWVMCLIPVISCFWSEWGSVKQTRNLEPFLKTQHCLNSSPCKLLHMENMPTTPNFHPSKGKMCFPSFFVAYLWRDREYITADT